MRSPKWLRDEIILCLDLYLNHNGIKIQKNDPKVAELSDTLNKLPIVSNKVELSTDSNLFNFSISCSSCCMIRVNLEVKDVQIRWFRIHT